MTIIRGDNPTAPCFGATEDGEPYRMPQHAWRSLMREPSPTTLEGCTQCGAIRCISALSAEGEKGEG